MSELAVIVPTRGRPDNIRKVIGAWDFTNAWDHADLILVADADDPEIRGYRDLADSIHRAGSDALTLIEVPQWVPMVHKLNAAALVAAGQYWAVGFAGDDHLPQTIGWARRYLTVLHELQTGMVYSDDGYQGRKLATEWAVTSDVIRVLGRMVPAPVEHMYCDNSMMDLFGGSGAMRWLYEVRIEHMHPITGKAPTDAQYQRTNGREQYSKDRRGYERWKREQMAADVATLRGLRVGLSEVPLPEPEPPQPSQTSRPSRPSPTRHPTRYPTRYPARPQPQGRTTVQPPRHFDQVRATTPENIMMALADFAAQVSTGHEIVELGVFCGRTTLMMAWGAAQGNHAHVTGVDAWALPGNTYAPPFTDDESRRWADHWVQTLGYAENITLVNDFSHNVAAGWAGRLVGLLFVDADHSKEGCRGDIVGWAPHLFPCARIAVDDYGHPDWPGVREAVDDLVAQGFLNPVQVFHDRLAVTTLTEQALVGLAANATLAPPVEEPELKPELEHDLGLEPAGLPTAVTSEGVFPSPAPEQAAPATVEPDGEVASEVASEPGLRGVVYAGELQDVPAGTTIDTLSMAYLKELAKVREIILSTRVHKKADTIQALLDGH